MKAEGTNVFRSSASRAPTESLDLVPDFAGKISQPSDFIRCFFFGFCPVTKERRR